MICDTFINNVDVRHTQHENRKKPVSVVALAGFFVRKCSDKHNQPNATQR
ncbi:hypothetical protein [Vibrio parahaemolyticus]|nr:hypothetical protein [Vibrio parahaemolyticus]